MILNYHATRFAKKNSAPLFHPIRSKTKTNRDSLAHLFPRFASATSRLSVLIGSLYRLCPLWLARLIALVLRHSIESHSKCASYSSFFILKFVFTAILTPSKGLGPCTFNFLKILIVHCFVHHQFDKKFVQLT